jgi:hypothetical protein
MKMGSQPERAQTKLSVPLRSALMRLVAAEAVLEWRIRCQRIYCSPLRGERWSSNFRELGQSQGFFLL